MLALATAQQEDHHFQHGEGGQLEGGNITAPRPPVLQNYHFAAAGRLHVLPKQLQLSRHVSRQLASAPLTCRSDTQPRASPTTSHVLSGQRPEAVARGTVDITTSKRLQLPSGPLTLPLPLVWP